MYRAHDPETGARMWRKGTAEITSDLFYIQFSAKKELWFTVGYEPKNGEFTPNDPSNPMIRLYAATFKDFVSKEKGLTREEKNALVRYLIDGVAAINRKWPLCGAHIFTAT
jgi:hypothetical protein